MIATLDLTVLACVVGGGGMNVDHTSTRWRVVQVGEVPVPIPITRTMKQRTPFGACIDRGVSLCERTGGDGAHVADCKLTEVHRCGPTQETP